LSQEKLARLADCSTNLVRLVEHGYRPSDEMLGRIAAALGCNASELGP
jgi:transcriptional regulator with XRE-family HTH domain